MNSDKKKSHNDIHDSTTDFFLKIVKEEQSENESKKEKDTSTKETFNLKTTKTLDKASTIYNYINKAFDKLLSSNMNIMIISVIMTLVLFFTISGGDFLSSPTSGTTLENVPIKVEGLSDDYEISGIPNDITVGLIGPSLDIYTTKITKDYEVYLDVSDYKDGDYTVNLKSRNFPESLTVMLVPSSLKVKISTKIEATYQLSYQFINEDQLDPEYSVTVTEMSQKNVMIRASKETLGKIAKVSACIDVANQNQEFEQDAKIKAYDQQGNELDVDIANKSVHVKCAVSSYSKVVSVKPEFIGDLANGYALTNYSLSHNTVTIYGTKEKLKDISEVTCQIDITNLKSSTSINNVEIKKSDDINKLSATSTDVSLEIEREITKKFDKIPIKVLNIADNKKVSFIGGNKYATVSITGAESKVSALTTKNIQASIDVNNLKVGNQKVQVSVAVDDEKLKIELLSSKQVSINIERK